MAIKVGGSQASKVGRRSISKGVQTSKAGRPSQRTVSKQRTPISRHRVPRGAQGKARLPTANKAASTPYLRQKAVKLAREQEMNLVQKTGKGTRPWTPSQIAQLQRGKWVKGYEGHHLRDVSSHSKRFAGDPRNVKFLTRRQHLREHNNSFRNPTTGRLIDRAKLARQNRIERRTLAPKQGA